VCSTVFIVKETSLKLYCNKKCNPNHGGYRAGSGRAKTGYYKGIYCGSTYELVWVIHAIDTGVDFKRFPGSLEKDGVKYFPDFLVGDTIIELKGYEKLDTVDKKTKVAESFGYKVIVLRKENLETQFNWVKMHYAFTQVHELYDNYAPKYVYKCNHCDTMFSRDRQIKTDIKFCSRICSGKGHEGRVKKQELCSAERC
jgi:hypothetical protein